MKLGCAEIKRSLATGKKRKRRVQDVNRVLKRKA